MSFVKRVYRRIRTTPSEIRFKIHRKIINSKLYIRRKENREYARFLNAFKEGYASDFTLSPNSECLYRQTYYNDRNRQLVQMCKDNDVEGISDWYAEDDSDKMYFDEYFENRMSMRVIARHILETAKQNARILDVACGHGSIDRELAKAGFTVKGIDLNPNRVNELKPYIFDAECTDVDNMVGENSYDILIALEMLEHVPDVKRTLKKMWTLLAPGGLLYLSVPNEYKIDHEQHVRLFDKDSMICLLQGGGFRILSVIPLAYLNHENENDLVCVCKKDASDDQNNTFPFQADS